MNILGATRSKLREICRSPSPQTLLIIVPGLGTAAPDTWFGGKGKSWLNFLPDDALPSPVVFYFEHGLGSDMNSRVWSDVLERGLGLLEDLLVLLNDQEEFRNCAIVFIAYSLGGIILKQCLTNALERITDFGAVVRATAACILIATPHSKSSEAKEWNQPQLLAGTRSYHKRGNPTGAEDGKCLANVCLRFEGVVTNLPILTLCESLETNIKSLFIRTSRTLIVPKNGCTIQSRLEEFVEINASHLEICNVTSNIQLEPWIKKAVTTSLSRIAREIQEDILPSALDESNIADHDAADQLSRESTAATSGNDLSNQATVAVSDSRKDLSLPLSDFSTVRGEIILPCHIIPSTRNRDFFGRDDIINMIDDFLAPLDEEGSPKRDTKTFTLCGPGGIGKTQVANEYAITHMYMYEAIFWVHAEKATTVADEFSRVAERLGLVLEGTTDARDLVVTRELVKGWLAKPVRSYNRTDNTYNDEVSWLLVFDNVSDADLLSDFWPPTGSSGSILVTSRDALAKAPLYQIQDGIDLPPLSNAGAAELLLKLTWRNNDTTEQILSLKVAEKLGGMPLALIQFAGVMVRQDLSFADFLSRYEEEETHGELFNLSLTPSHKRTNYGFTLASVWALEELKYSSGLLDVMAFLDPDGIPEKFLKEAVGQVQLPDYPKNVTEYQDARSELLKSSLITNDRTASNLSIHRLIQDGARAKMQLDRAKEVFFAVVDVLWSMWPPAEPGVRHHVARWKDCELLSPQILRLKERYTRAGTILKSKLIDNLGFAILLNELGWYFQERGYTPEALHCYDIAQTNVKHIITTTQNQNSYSALGIQEADKAHFLLAETHNNIAGASVEYNDAKKALHHFQIYNKMLLDKRDEQTIMFDSRLASSFFNLGMSFTMNGKSLALINCGLTFWLMNRYGEASDILGTALKEREELLGPNDRQSMITGRILHCLGNVRRSQGLLGESLKFHERALLHFKETVGNNHHRTGNSCFKVAEYYNNKGKLLEAIELLDQAIKIFDRHTWYRGEEGRALFLKGVVLEKQGQKERSEICLQHAHSKYEAVSKNSIAEKDLALNDFDQFVHAWGR